MLSLAEVRIGGPMYSANGWIDFLPGKLSVLPVFAKMFSFIIPLLF